MLAIATGALGFGLFGAEFRVSTEPLPAMKLVAGATRARSCWVALAESVRVILQSDGVTGRQVARGPLMAMFLVVVYVVCVFVAGISGQSTVSRRAGAGRHARSGVPASSPARSGTRG